MKQIRKIEVIKDIPIMGCPTIKTGIQFKVESNNAKFVYVTYLGCSLRLSLKDVKIVY